MDKQQLRHSVREQIEKMTQSDYRKRSRDIIAHLLQLPSIKEGQTIAVTISSFPEVDTTMLIEALWAMKKTVVVPKCRAKTREMTFYAIDGFHQLETVYMHLIEPIPAETKRIERQAIDAIIVPGIVFDCKGYRIGYGGGYYDRYLVGYTGSLIALAFKEQIVEKVPFEAHDLPIQTIVTETSVIDCEREREA